MRCQYTHRVDIRKCYASALESSMRITSRLLSGMEPLDHQRQLGFGQDESLLPRRQPALDRFHFCLRFNPSRGLNNTPIGIDVKRPRIWCLQ